MRGLARSASFLFKAPFILAVLFIISWATHGDWFRWAALGIGIAWVMSLFRVVQAAVVLGGLAALGAYIAKQR